jgi:anaerobic ribonucleoside-triphosphate reductase activating protein
MMLQISGTVNDSIVDGPGLRFTVFVQGCPHHCTGCHNPQTHPFEGGTTMDTAALLEKIRSNPLLDGVTFSGGEPFCQAEALAALGAHIRKMGLNIMTYTGYTFEYLFEHRHEQHYGDLLSVTDWLVDGPFLEEQKSYQLRFKGSANQRILDVPKSLTMGKAMEAEEL